MTKENQNYVAYSEVKALKDSGHKPYEIPSVWNSGKRDFVGKKGVNSYGVQYDTPKYVAGVLNTYKDLSSRADYSTDQIPQNKEQSSTNNLSAPKLNTKLPVTPQKPIGFLDKVKNTVGDVATGLGQSIVGTVYGLGKIGASAVGQDLGKTYIGAGLERGLKPQNTTQEVAKGVGDVAQFFTPASGASIASKVPKLAKYAPSIASGLSSAVITAGQTGEVGKEAIASGVASAVMPFSSKYFSKTLNLVNMGKPLKSALAGAGTGFVGGAIAGASTADVSQEPTPEDRVSNRIESGLKAGLSSAVLGGALGYAGAKMTKSKVGGEVLAKQEFDTKVDDFFENNIQTVQNKIDTLKGLSR
jgi:hypothetical protein